MAPPRGGGGQRQRGRAPREPRAVDPEQLLAEAEEQEEKAERHVGANAVRGAQRALEMYARIQALPSIDLETRLEAIFGRARCCQLVSQHSDDNAVRAEALTAALSLFADGLAVMPDDWEAWYNRGQVALNLGELRSDSTAAQLALFQESLDCHRRADALLEALLAEHQHGDAAAAEEVRDDRIDTLTGGAQAATQASLLAAPQESDVLFVTAEALLHSALSLASDERRPSVLIAWADACGRRAADERVASPAALYERALELLASALQSPDVDPVAALCDRADVAYNYATNERAAPPAERRRALADIALHDLRNAVQLKDSDPPMLSRLGDVHLLRFHLGGGPAELAEAEAAFLAAMRVPFKPFNDTDTLHNLAATYALGGDAARCLDVLAQWRAVATPQDVQELIADGDFGAVRDLPAFAQLVGLR